MTRHVTHTLGSHSINAHDVGRFENDFYGPPPLDRSHDLIVVAPQLTHSAEGHGAGHRKETSHAQVLFLAGLEERECHRLDLLPQCGSGNGQTLLDDPAYLATFELYLRG